MNTQIEKEELILRYLLGDATPGEVRALEDWIQADPANRRTYQELKNIWNTAAPAFNPDDIDIEKAYDIITPQLMHKKGKMSSVLLLWQRIAAILLLPLVIAFSYLLLNEKEEIPQQIVEQEVFAPYGTHSRINLPDGSIVWLNAGSSIRYPAVFAPGRRIVHLNGEAYFEVKADVENPFWVEAQEVEVRATGTKFSVEAYLKDSLVSVTMVSGKIDVRIGNNPLISMTPGERMVYNLNGARCELTKTDPYKWYAWKDGMIVFRDDPLDYVFKKIGQTFNVDISVQDTSIANHLYRATFEEESLDEILRLLRLTAPIRYENHRREKSAENSYAKQRIDVYRAKK